MFLNFHSDDFFLFSSAFVSWPIFPASVCSCFLIDVRFCWSRSVQPVPSVVDIDTLPFVDVNYAALFRCWFSWFWSSFLVLFWNLMVVFEYRSDCTRCSIISRGCSAPSLLGFCVQRHGLVEDLSLRKVLRNKSPSFDNQVSIQSLTKLLKIFSRSIALLILSTQFHEPTQGPTEGILKI